MSQDLPITLTELRTVGLSELHKRWGWILALGILLVAVGTVALGASVFTSLATMVFIGWLMIGGGIVQALHSFTVKNWGGFFIDLLTGILYVVVGFLIVAHPAETGIALTLLIAMFLIFGGVFRIAVSLMHQFPNWGWVLLNGVISLILGILIWRQWPVSGLWVIGMFVGIDMMFNGWSLIMLGLVAKDIPKAGESPETPEAA
ncbi:HdeD family acid-resistance protein [Thalassoglobus sp. JC818]|uniref:HdeD family acid-resistance protein n=1 Tax=Thalassoglobus sp. JC818 TaxID=3232136 RepID=UPI003457630A